MSHAIVTACMVAIFGIIVFAKNWNVTVRDWVDKQINAAKPV